MELPIRLVFACASFAACALLAGCSAEPGVQSEAVPFLAFPFDRSPSGALPEGWRVGATHGEGALASWAVVADPSAPSPPNVLALTQANASGGTFNLCWTDAVRFGDGELDLAFRADRGAEDQGGGPMWRVQDENNYYLCRMNPLESNFRLYCVKDGRREQLASAKTTGQPGTWHRIRVEHVGQHIVCTFDGGVRLEADDARLSAAGGVGLWTKADAATSFDDLVIYPRP